MPAGNLHLTLAFLGVLGDERRDALARVGGDAAAGSSAIEVALDRVGHFRAARVAWAGQAGTPPALQRLFDALGSALAAAELPVERRPFHPHVTLLRHCPCAPGERAWAGARWRAEALTLMASETLPEGARYRALASWPFAASPIPQRRG